jgi:hypothetical protein
VKTKALFRDPRAVLASQHLRGLRRACPQRGCARPWRSTGELLAPPQLVRSAFRHSGTIDFVEPVPVDGITFYVGFECRDHDLGGGWHRSFAPHVDAALEEAGYGEALRLLDGDATGRALVRDAAARFAGWDWAHGRRGPPALQVLADWLEERGAGMDTILLAPLVGYCARRQASE